MTESSSRHLWQHLLAVLWLLAGAAPLRADVKRPATPPVPVARPAQAEAIRGFPVAIRLEGVTSSARVLQFIMRQPPKHGRLEGAPTSAGKDSAVVRYVGDPGSTATSDSFSYAVKVEGSGSSEEAVVSLRLSDPAAVLEVPSGVDLGRLLAMEVSEHGVRIANKGNAPFRATVPLPEGWSWAVPPGGRFDVAPGGQIEAVVRVRPKEAGEVDEKVLLRPGYALRFTGRVLPPFLGYPSLLRLQWEPEPFRRAYRFNIRNNRGEAMRLRLSAPAGVEVPASVEIPVAESVEVAVTCAGQVSVPLAGKIRLEAPGWVQEIDYEAAAAPAVMELSGVGADGVVDFGVLEKAEGAVRTLVLRNVGGTASVVRWDGLRFFVVEGLEDEAVLAPQAERTFAIRPRPDEPGRLREELALRMAGGDRLLKLQAEIDPKASQAALMAGTVLEVKAAAPGSPELARPRSERGRQLRVQVLTAGLMEAIPNADASLPTVNAVRLIEAETGPERLVFEWDAPGPGVWTYKVLVRMLRNHGLQQAPIPEYGTMDNVAVSATPLGGRAEVTHLRPGVRWSCRIVGLRSDGVATKAGDDLTFLTPPVGPSRWPWRVLGLLGVISVGLYVRQKWREDVKWKN